jgi:hypothetical protein
MAFRQRSQPLRAAGKQKRRVRQSDEGWGRDFTDGGRVGTFWNDLFWHSNLTNRTGHVVAC